MKNFKQNLSTTPKNGITRREGLSLTLLGSALALAGCGGGGSSGASTTPAASSPAAAAPVGGSNSAVGSSSTGAVAGFGSIIVGGVRFDDSAASVQDDDGVSMATSDVKLGMVVRVKGGKKTDDGSSVRAKADSIDVYSELQGPVDSKTADSLVVLGQTVKITATTFFEDGLSLASLVVGAVVEVHGFVDPLANTMAATRIESKPNAKAFKLQGAIKALNTTAKTFSIGTVTISYLTADVPAGLTLANDLVVRVRLALTPLTGTRTALKIRKFEIDKEDRNEAKVEGIVTAFTSTSAFSVNGLAVDASAATFDASKVGIVLGARVEVEGSLVSGVLVAKKVSVEGRPDAAKFELHGVVSLLDKTAKTFVLRSTTVNYSAASFAAGVTAATLANGQNLEVKGSRSAGNVIMATLIALDK